MSEKNAVRGNKCLIFNCGVNEHDDIKWVYRHTHRGDMRRRWIRFLHSREFQLLLGLLLLLDVFILFTQIFLDSYFPPCFAIVRNADCRLADPSFNASILQFVEFHCNTDDNVRLNDIKNYLFYVSLTILVIFEVELALLILVLGPVGFLRNFGYIFDFFIISTSLCLEIILHDTESGAAIGLLIAARVWRLIRIGHGLLFSSATRRKAVGDFLSVADSQMSLDHKLGQGIAIDIDNELEDEIESRIEEEIKKEDEEEQAEAEAEKHKTSL